MFRESIAASHRRGDKVYCCDDEWWVNDWQDWARGGRRGTPPWEPAPGTAGTAPIGRNKARSLETDPMMSTSHLPVTAFSGRKSVAVLCVYRCRLVNRWNLHTLIVLDANTFWVVSYSPVCIKPRSSPSLHLPPSPSSPRHKSCLANPIEITMSILAMLEVVLKHSSETRATVLHSTWPGPRSSCLWSVVYVYYPESLSHLIHSCLISLARLVSSSTPMICSSSTYVQSFSPIRTTPLTIYFQTASHCHAPIRLVWRKGPSDWLAWSGQCISQHRQCYWSIPFRLLSRCSVRFTTPWKKPTF